MRLALLRHEYRRPPLRAAGAPADPLVLFRRWLNAALRAGLREPTAMALATSDARARPGVRFVLLKQADARGFTFFTRYSSAKGRALAARPAAALALWWPGLERQVRVEGRVGRVGAPESDAYFALRPRGAQLGAWASPQSRVVTDRAELERRLAAAAARFRGREVPRPRDWGGFRVVPSTIEFWQGRPDRLHDRLRYTRRRGGWSIDVLAP